MLLLFDDHVADRMFQSFVDIQQLLFILDDFFVNSFIKIDRFFFSGQIDRIEFLVIRNYFSSFSFFSICSWRAFIFVI